MKIIPKGYVREKNNNPVSFDEQCNLTDQITGEKGTMMLPGLTVRGVNPKTRARNYSSAYHPEDALEFLDIMTRPLTRPFSVSQQIGAIRNKINGGTYLGSLLGNKENLGIVSKNFNKEHPYLSTAANIGIDIFTPFGIKGINKGIQTGNRYYLARQIYKDINNSSLKSEQIPLNIGWGPKQTIPVSRASNRGNVQSFFPNRWDVVNEGANPHGIWFQGKLGYPRTDFTNPGKGEKAAKARALFANRSMQTQGDLTLEKPIITIGDVPSRSQLSYYADNAGADGLIYNGVYDNGYNNNQVILSFKKMNKTNDNKSPIKPSIGDITNEAEVRTLYPIYEKMKNSSHYREFSTPFAVGGTKSLATRLFPKSITREAMKDVHNYVSSPDYLAQDFVKRNKSPYSIDIANHMYGLDESLNFVDYRAMNDYGRVFNERIKKTLPLAKQRGTLRIDKNPTIIVADSQGRQFLQNRFFEELNKVNGIHYGDPITPTGILAKKYYYKTSPAKDVFDIDPASFADRKNNTIVLVPSSGDYENMYKYTLPHEKTHIFIDGRKEVALFGDDRGFGALPRRDGYIDIDLDLYLNRPDEQLARGTQIKNYLGIVDESPITPEQLKYAAQNYVKDTGYDNNMTDFFRSIKDYKKAAKWLSLAPSVSPIIKTYSND